MKEWLLQGNGLYVQAILGALGIVNRLVVQSCLRHMTVQTEKGNNSRNRILQQIKGRFENIYRMNHGIEQMEAFVQKQIYLLRFCGLRLSTWKVISDQTLLAVLLFGAASGVYCWQNESGTQAIQYLLFGALVVIVQCFCYLWADIGRRERELVVNLEDYLGNTYAVHLRRGMRKDEVSGTEQENVNIPGEMRQKNTGAAAGVASLGAEQIAAAREEKKPIADDRKTVGGRRVLTEEESKLIEEILQEYLN